MGMEISSGQPIQVGGGYGSAFGGDSLMFLAFLAMMGGFGGGWGMGGRGPMGPMGPVQVQTGDQAPVSSAQFQNGMNMQNLADQNRDILGATNNVYHDITANLDNRYSELQRDIAANAVMLQQVQANSQQCCCQIKQEIANLNLENEKRFNALQLQTEQKFAALDARMYQSDIQRLRDQLAQQSQNMQDLKADMRMYGTVKMPNQYTFNAGPGPFQNAPLPPFPMASGF